ncbi:uncharacterized protein ASPGLDRAFT_1517131 [Aspergillus glaucus CBS 516.65]|uniref:Uncharacterized protein n=1 Tax=Aspergillus glaucus CBS 516.65 TaxID=1160497 RepID=A0A1L9VLU8_ASPGL|nr:hypothetical protein ASPGLDRAFT_1517131 [Aspergillus glaucus CBS 516.65]OJJ84850.1 hypothetical protein ASPGLDRAFT_1517131 [Aspergillus glaucus CBS 516.65]
MPNPLQILRKKSTGSHHEDNCPQHTAHNNHPNTYAINFTTTTTTSISKSNSLSSILSLKSSSNRKHRHSSLPLPIKRPGLNHNGSSPSERQPLKETNKSRLQRLKLRAPRLSAPASSKSVETTTIAKLRIDSNQEDTTTTTKARVKSRPPTPLDLPDEDLCSQKAYQREGRKSVLSSLGRRAMGKEKDKMENNNTGTRRWSFSYQYSSNNKQSGYHDTASGTDNSSYVPPQAYVHEDEPLSNPDCVESVARTTKSRTMIPIPTSASTPSFTKIEEGRKRHSLSSLVSPNGRLSSRVLSSRFPRKEATIEEGQADDIQQIPMARKVQFKAHATSNPRPLPQLPKEKGSRLSGTFASLDEMTNKMPEPMDNVEPRRFYWTRRSSETLKKPSYDTNPTMPPIYAHLDEPSYRRTNRTHTLTSTRTQERSGHSTRADRMAQPQAPPLGESQPHEEDDEPTHPLHQASQAQPTQYWLGRFVTLTNAFHYEDSFNQPDTTTGFGMLSSYSRPDGSAERNLANYRVKRAFMVLENACLTEEASRSLRAFQSEYIGVKGDRWMA